MVETLRKASEEDKIKWKAPVEAKIDKFNNFKHPYLRNRTCSGNGTLEGCRSSLDLVLVRINAVTDILTVRHKGWF